MVRRILIDDGVVLLRIELLISVLVLRLESWSNVQAPGSVSSPPALIQAGPLAL